MWMDIPTSSYRPLAADELSASAFAYSVPASQFWPARSWKRILYSGREKGIVSTSIERFDHAFGLIMKLITSPRNLNVISASVPWVSPRCQQMRFPIPQHVAHMFDPIGPSDGSSLRGITEFRTYDLRFPSIWYTSDGTKMGVHPELSTGVAVKSFRHNRDFKYSRLPSLEQERL